MYYLIALVISFFITTREVEDFISHTTTVCIRTGSSMLKTRLTSQFSLQNNQQLSMVACAQNLNAQDKKVNPLWKDDSTKKTDIEEEVKESLLLLISDSNLQKFNLRSSDPIQIGTLKGPRNPYIKRGDPEISAEEVKKQIAIIQALK
jgi:hypothetical protein